MRGALMAGRSSELGGDTPIAHHAIEIQHAQNSLLYPTHELVTQSQYDHYD
jgi:hypothetical protein